MCKQSFAMWLTVVAVGVGSVGCQSKAGTGAAIGGIGGGALGAGIGSMSHSRAGEGALIGVAAGAIGGALIGHGMDEADNKKERERERERASPESTYSDRPAYSSQPISTSPAGRVTKQDVIDWTARGTKDDLIVDRINRSGTVFYLVAADENHLRDAGVSENVIRAMKDTARR